MLTRFYKREKEAVLSSDAEIFFFNLNLNNSVHLLSKQLLESTCDLVTLPLSFFSLFLEHLLFVVAR